MKNLITIDYDSEREDPIIIAKSEDQKEADNNPEQYQEMLMDDLATMCKGIAKLIEAAHKDGIMNRGKALESCMSIIKGGSDITGSGDVDK